MSIRNQNKMENIPIFVYKDVFSAKGNMLIKHEVWRYILREERTR